MKLKKLQMITQTSNMNVHIENETPQTSALWLYFLTDFSILHHKSDRQRKNSPFDGAGVCPI